METQFEEQVSFGVAEAFRRMSVAQAKALVEGEDVTQMAQTLRDAAQVAATAPAAAAQPAGRVQVFVDI